MALLQYITRDPGMFWRVQQRANTSHNTGSNSNPHCISNCPLQNGMFNALLLGAVENDFRLLYLSIMCCFHRQHELFQMVNELKE